MFDFKGFDDWIEVFAGGPQTDCAGDTRDGDEIIDRIISTFDPEYYEPPAVIGHPKTNSPAWGWVTAVKREGRKLLVKFKDIQPDFEQMVRAGLFKKRSISIFPDGRLRHVGWLGAAAPAVRGLKDVAFEDGAAVEFVSQITCKNEEGNEMPNDGMDWGGFFKGFFSGLGKAHPAPAVPAGGGGQGTGQNQFNEADIEAAEKRAADKAKKESEAEFAEKQRKAAYEARKKEISEFCDTLVKDGKLPPSMGKSGGLAEFCEAVAGIPGVIQFSEEGQEKKIHPATWFMEFMGGLSESKIFSEVATKDKAGKGRDGEVVNYAEAARNKV